MIDELVSIVVNGARTQICGPRERSQEKAKECQRGNFCDAGVNGGTEVES